MTPCAHCGKVVAVRVGGQCRACYTYQRRTGQARPAYLVDPQSRRCPTCGDAARYMTRGECRTCYVYRLRTGRPRPALTMRHCVNCSQRAKKGQWRQGLCARCYAALYSCDALGGVA